MKNVDSKVIKTKSGKTSSKCALCGSKKSRSMKEQEAKEMLNSLGLKKPSSKIPLFGDILF